MNGSGNHDPLAGDDPDGIPHGCRRTGPSVAVSRVDQADGLVRANFPANTCELGKSHAMVDFIRGA